LKAIAMHPLQRHFLFAAILLGSLGANAGQAQGRFEAEAVAGQPFGVGRIIVDLSKNMLPEPLGIEGLGLSERNGRAMYPTFDSPAVGKLLRGALESDTPLTAGGPVREQVGGLLRGILDRPPRVTLYFLFRGEGPLELSLDAKNSIPIKLDPRGDSAAHRELLQLWWKQYSKPAGLLTAKPDYPPLVETYAMATLARRLNLRLPEKQQTPSAHAELRKEIGVNLGTESLATAMLQDRILGLNALDQPADQSLPPLNQSPMEAPPTAADVQVEPMAMRVPAECFYARFGSFANFLWFQDTMAKWGGDAQNLIALRGLDRSISRRIETQLVLKQTALSRLLGDATVADVAIVGTDMFFREGASFGILFQARNQLALSAHFLAQRQQRMAAGGVSEEKLTLQGKPVFYLSSPDGSVRSYYAIDGDYHFFSTSRRLVERFLATASGQNTLGGSDEFRHARSLMPLERGDTVWVYLSDAFFRNLTSPGYRTEMVRRLQASADIELVELARLAAVAEGKPGETIENLKSGSLLPPEFGPLPDGSSTILDGELVRNSLRGRRGAFVPVLDMDIQRITRAELAEYKKFEAYYRSHWGRMDPLAAGLKRTALGGGLERVAVDVLASPFAPEHFKALREWLGPADRQQLARVPGDMAAFEWVATEQRIFGGLRDIAPLPSTRAFPLQSSTNAPSLQWRGVGRLRDFLIGYVGATGPLGPIAFLNLGIPPQSDAEGYAVSPLGGWRRSYGTYTLFSFQREVLDEVVPRLHLEEAPRPAQIRLRIDDVSQASIPPALNQRLYGRTRETSLGNLRLLHALEQQLRVPAAQCRQAAETLLDAQLICPLDGEYVLRETPGSPPRWTSTALTLEGEQAARAFVAPPLSWFRGLTLDAEMTEKSVSAHAEVLMQGPANP